MRLSKINNEQNYDIICITVLFTFLSNFLLKQLTKKYAVII